MSAPPVERPVWRRFRPRRLSRAAAHVRAGGFAAIVDDRDSVQILLGLTEAGKLTELGLCALLTLEQRRFQRVKTGPAAGLALVRVRPRFRPAVLDWCARDTLYEGPTRTMPLDCTTCAACCHGADVRLDAHDLARFRAAGRRDLAGRAYVKRSRDGRVTLRLADDGRCQLLGPDKRCTIYEIRPGDCRAFVAGSEACLSARRETLGLRDGAAWDEILEAFDRGPRTRGP
ncbi:YkgJ family cysteine cluster protein [Polyangium jinanense]|uniref:YkgJ family cysteine cluster protein n=1 Tax=Polyangium jinanense TaxID=2829994 RepID=A0A9X4ARN8_9BACT|nr:YkgJ family cysteine cluster protein [Polyangium jinanense]MDC3955641.1 YkgJ family cysteine cluster protein [Polyangium jinanense]MDC3982283.1 YkgJ family cysteine cluster protein [Polyangium jinanense]